MSTLEIILIVIAVLVVLIFIGGLLGARRRDERQEPHYAEHVAAADSALEQARAADRGWDRALMEEAARGALRDERPQHRYENLHLVLVEDRPGTDEDQAHFMAVGSEGEVRVVLARHGDHWHAHRVE
jgi:hypothetical protein